ncbi:4-hydroxy-tetrahydrodipicolinate reductase [Arcanobacterium bovis]|uniref:4-hydroxy-tetrahydrodipicolinate reductase n=1 Tax=Arcanobacterium bovis TaxID=2529275 RepID=A0A4Q9V0X3_9ACTO|nr:4-hydroxy-tetrahydrodipicolinate reductase [Arcanobacterium bovis]TBW22734.1 4-hydroxy-tetrahydrodipicolinate reductase [Arcanobacterium bovis]
MKVAVVGAHGRMGATVVQAVNNAPDLELVAQLDAADAISAQSLNGAEVAVEFTVPSQTDDNVHALLDAGVHVVVGTTGWTPERLARVHEHARQLGKGVLIAPNFSISAVLVMHFAKQAAAHFESVEIIELHHPNKVDAPSGTAVSTAKGIAEVRAAAGMSPCPDATESDPLGARGAVIDGINVHAVRLRGLNAHEEVVFGNPGEQLILRQDSFDRESFMPGVLLAVRKVGESSGLTVGLESYLGLDG